MKYTDRTERRLRGYFRPEPGPISPLHEVIAPAIVNLPADIVAPLLVDFHTQLDSWFADPPLSNSGLTDWSGKYLAQDWLADEVAALKKARLDMAFDEGAIEDEARKWSAICGSLHTYERMLPTVEKLGVDIPEIKGHVTGHGIAKRWQDVNWWRRQFRKHYTRSAEGKLRELGHVQKKRQCYASDRAVNWRRARKLRDRALLQELVAVSDKGDQLNLWDIVEKSQANPALRRAELMVRLKGFEEIADAAGHVADFWTLTTPSAYHRTNKSGSENPNYEGFTAREGQAWLCKMWARVRAKLKRLSILVYGFRIAEPHHDGTPHWHIIMFTPSQHRERVRTIMREAWLSEYGNEVGAREYRVKLKAIDKAKGSACGYVSKYIAKNIDGFQVGEDLETEGQAATESCHRVAAWASAHGIRQFQQIGGPQVTIYRELRRIRESIFPERATPDNETSIDHDRMASDRLLEEARSAADCGDWARFIAALGGIEKGRRGDVQLEKEITGEVTRYDELRAAQIIGVSCCQSSYMSSRLPLSSSSECAPAQQHPPERCVAHIHILKTRVKVWKIERKAGGFFSSSKYEACSRGSQKTANVSGLNPPLSFQSELGPVSITVRAQKTYHGLTLEEIARRYLSRGDPPRLH
ncbi:MAG TPA: replication endonuclease [Steroidobacteraceae bacterium]|nr:replication endonuclease [Steroidobacteraceae bacterium]